jgi:hypothetical protein
MSYPIVDQSVKTVKSNKYGQQGITFSKSAYNTAYNTLAAPVVPYFETPYSYIHPYIVKADELGDKTLNKVDSTFPIITKPTNEAYSDVKGYAMFPVRKTNEGKDHVFNVYSNEKSKHGDGMVPFSKALVTTVLVLMTETAEMVRNLMTQAAENGQEVVDQVQAKAS